MNNAHNRSPFVLTARDLEIWPELAFIKPRSLNAMRDAAAFAAHARSANYFRDGETRNSSRKHARRDWAGRAGSEERRAARCALKIQAEFAF